jgi:Ni,Fe-hydrogenase I large subunit
MARVLDVLHIVTEGYHGRLDSVRMPDGAGLAVVRTARGMLLHRVRLEAERVKDYLTVAPTEWNFHPRGVLVAGLRGLPVDNRDRLAQLAGLHVLSLDPCVEYSIEINGSAA